MLTVTNEIKTPTQKSKHNNASSEKQNLNCITETNLAILKFSQRDKTSKNLVHIESQFSV